MCRANWLQTHKLLTILRQQFSIGIPLIDFWRLVGAMVRLHFLPHCSLVCSNWLRFFFLFY
jgi:hypothetical protein